MSSLYEDQEVLDDEGLAREIIAAAQGGVLVSQPATVLSYDKETQTARVQPVLRVYTVLWESEVEGFEPLAAANVPVCFPGSGPFSLTWPIEEGSQGLLVFCERDSSAWFASGGTDVEPSDRAMFNEQNAFFIPELRSPASPRPPHAVSDDHPVMSLDVNQRLLVADANANKALALAEGVQARLNALENAFNLHTHSLVNVPVVTDPVSGVGVANGVTGPGPTAGTTLLSDVANTRVFVDQ